jgi:hypothetical protein
VILESIVTTISDDGSINIAPMGPYFDSESNFFELRPFETSNTCRNLRQTPSGVLHVTDDVLLLAQAAIDQFDQPPETTPASKVAGAILADCCRWYEFNTTFVSSTGPRVTIQCEIVDSGRNRDFYGFNRAKHAVIEAAILATRINFVPIAEIHDQFARLETIVHKTGGEKESQAFALLSQHIQKTTVQSQCNFNLNI